MEEQTSSRGVKKKRTAEDKRSLRMAIVVALILVALLVAVVVVPKYIPEPGTTSSAFTYNGYEFEKKQVQGTSVDAYFVQFYDQRGYANDVPFHYPPEPLEPLMVDPAIKPALFNFDKSGTVYLSVEPNGNSSYVLSATEIAKILGKKLLGYNVKSALSSPIDGVYDTGVVDVTVNGTNQTQTFNRTLRTSQGILVRNCEDANDGVFVIQVKQMPYNYVAYANNCVTIAATNPDNAMMLTDALLYRLLGIMEN